MYWRAIVPVGITLVAWQKRLLTSSGCIAALFVGLPVTFTGWDVTGMLFTFFIAGSLATKLTAKYRPVANTTAVETEPPKTNFNDDQSDASKGRTAIQVLGTGGPPAILCLYSLLFKSSISSNDMAVIRVLILAYFSCSCGDTLASEIGGLSAVRPVLITTFKETVAGRDGGVSLLGLFASAVGGAIVAFPTLNFSAILAGTVYGFVGSLFDSYLGVLLQSPEKLKSLSHWKQLNVVVNLLSSLLTSLFAWVLIRFPALILPTMWGCIYIVFRVMKQRANQLAKEQEK